ncbi:MAG: hypothetical protein QE271_04710 [Bacteriovoracaceae bacterium]|nr:hypothetical protein [Bacteriovoracaceae bacterium]
MKSNFSKRSFLLFFLLLGNSSLSLANVNTNRVRCYLLDEQTLMKTDKSFEIESYKPISSRDQKLSTNDDYINSFNKIVEDKTNFLTKKHTNSQTASSIKINHFDYRYAMKKNSSEIQNPSEKNEISGFYLYFLKQEGQKNQVEILSIESYFNLGKDIPSKEEVLPMGLKIPFLNSQAEIKRYYLDALLRGGYIGRISISSNKGISYRILNSIQCVSLTDKYIYLSK